MAISDAQVRSLLERPSESLQVEIKTWLDTTDPLGIAKLVKAVFAIRNRNGGFLVLGFNDETLRPDPYGLNEAIEAAYHVDRIQGLVSAYAFDAFPIEVVLGERDGRQHAIVVIPDGVQVPVVAKSALHGEGGRKLIAEGALYFRTLNTNGTPSSAQIHPRDYRVLLDICFENREADIGRFLRRQLSGSEIGRVLQHLTLAPAPPDLRARTLAAMDAGASRFHEAIIARNQSAASSAVENMLTMEVALTLDPPRAETIPSREFQRTIASANPQLTGWPIWLDASNFGDSAQRPYVRDGAWETLLADLNGGWSQHFDFMRFEPRGEFYLRRVMQEDLSAKLTPRVALDPFLMTYRIAETLVVGLRIARTLGYDADATAGFAFRWSALAERSLSSWANPMRFLAAGGKSHTDVVQSYAEIPVPTPETAIAPFVARIAEPLFAAFSGYRFSPEAYEDLCRRLIERKLD